MKLLLDACVWGGARQELEVAGHDVVWAGEWPTDPGDEEILALAHREGRVLVTLDKDFGDVRACADWTSGDITQVHTECTVDTTTREASHGTETKRQWRSGL